MGTSRYIKFAKLAKLFSIQAVQQSNEITCGVDNYGSCATWRNHCQYDYIRTQCSATCNYCPEKTDVEIEGSGSDEISLESGELIESDAPADGCADVDPNCADYQKNNHCSFETIQLLCSTSCEVGPCGITPDIDGDVAIEGSGKEL